MMSDPSALQSLLPVVAAMEADADTICAEMAALPLSDYVPLPAYPKGVVAFLLDAGSWAEYFPGVDFEANRARCPVAYRHIQSIAGLRLAGFLHVGAGVSYEVDRRAHDIAVIRAELGLLMPADEAALRGKVAAVTGGCAVTGGQDDARVTLLFEAALPAPD